MDQTEIRLRASVAAILRNAKGEILVCERLNERNAWQFPQGGIDEGETQEEALARELWEEIGIKKSDFRILSHKGPYRYVFGEGRKKKGYHGKEQQYFLCEFVADDSKIKVKTAHPEFRAWKWIEPKAFQIGWLPAMKRDVYRAVLQDFFGIRI